VDRHGRISAGALANESGLTTGAVTTVVDRLEAAGCVIRVRDDLDRRKVWIEPTGSLQEINRRVFGYYQKLGPAMLRRFSIDQIKAVISFLEMSRFLNAEMAASLKEHLDPSATTQDQRLAQAAIFEKAVAANEARLQAEIDMILAKVEARSTGARPNSTPPGRLQGRSRGRRGPLPREASYSAAMGRGSVPSRLPIDLTM
jgi:DNA-binding MarR family transcriptional regulator